MSVLTHTHRCKLCGDPIQIDGSTTTCWRQCGPYTCDACQEAMQPQRFTYRPSRYEARSCIECGRPYSNADESVRFCTTCTNRMTLESWWNDHAERGVTVTMPADTMRRLYDCVQDAEFATMDSDERELLQAILAAALREAGE